jgi:hypothetical protein
LSQKIPIECWTITWIMPITVWIKAVNMIIRVKMFHPVKLEIVPRGTIRNII